VAIVGEGAHQQSLEKAATTIRGLGGGHDPIQQRKGAFENVPLWVGAVLCDE